MSSMNAIRVHDQDAVGYDALVAEYGSYAHDVLFGLCYEYVRAGDSLLDVGIGTGLSSVPFARAGLRVIGVDGSVEMLKVCQARGIATELLCRDLLDGPLPFPDATFRHVISCGVFHFVEELAPLVAEASRLLSEGGIFAFTTAVPAPWESGGSTEPVRCISHSATAGVNIYAHAPSYVHLLLREFTLSPLKLQYFYAHSFDHAQVPLLLAAHVAQKQEQPT